ncbi:MAG: OmpA family protein [bacterium]|nr:OmpA family protein [bacterium]
MKRRLGIILLALLMLTVQSSWAVEEVELPPAFEEIKAIQKQAKKLGAKGDLPSAWRQLDSHLGYAENNGGTEAQWAKIREEADRLLNQAAFMNKIREKKNGYETLLGRFDQALQEIASLNRQELDPLLSGSPQAEYLMKKLTARNFRRQVTIDSLTVANRQLDSLVGGRIAAQDSQITSLTVEVRALRQKLWETELRAGVAEADRSAAETVLTQKQQREASVTTLLNSITTDEGEVLRVGDNRLVMRLHGISFGVNSSQLKSGQDVLLAKISDALNLFPGAQAKVEGHTDDTGTRKANLLLSRRRAETVARTLESMRGWAEGSIKTEGFGPDRPVALNDTSAGRAKNRRIDLIIDLPE